MRLLHVVGARPNFMKVAPVMAALALRPGVEQRLVHTGQHYDANMSDVFFRQLGIPTPDVNLGIGSGSHAQQTAEIMQRFEPVVLDRRPDWVVVYGDINSTVAAALVCAKLGIRTAHVEAGLRSYDRAMPEEINRIVTDRIVDLLLTPSDDGDANLLREGVAAERIRLVGNVMIDTLVRLLPASEALWPALSATLGLGPTSGYALVTLHRPSNVDDPESLRAIMPALTEISRQTPVLFPIHPRTRRRLRALGLEPAADDPNLRIAEPLGYLEFLALQRHARLVVTDSGGIQEETTYLGVSCLTMRENTERPVTVTLGTNTLVGRDMGLLRREVEAVLRGDCKRGSVPPLWDGRAGERVADALCGSSA